MGIGDNYFQGNPIRLDRARSRFPLNHNWRGTFNAGRWVPFFTQEVLAGDTFKVDANLLVRSSIPAVPVMDNATISVEFFYVPFDLLLSRSYMTPSTSDSLRSWRYFFGAQDSTLNMPTPDANVALPTLEVHASDYLVGGLADCLGIPIPQDAGDDANYYKVNCLKALAYYAVYNEFLRDPNTMSPVVFSVSSGGAVSFAYNADAGIPVDLSGEKFASYGLVPACANHGFFGSALPWPQRNSTSVTLPLGITAPVKDKNGYDGSSANPMLLYFKTGDPLSTMDGVDLTYKRTTSNQYYGEVLANGTVRVDRVVFGTSSPGGTTTGLVADLQNATAASINTIRTAFAVQRWYEQLARSGNRYDEMIQGMFGVTPPSKGNRPEYLGGKDIPMNMSQVNGTGDSNLGKPGADCNTFDAGHYFTKSFTEPGIILGLMCVRTHDSFAQGVDPFDIKSERTDFWWPQFANLGEIGLSKKLLYVKGSTTGAFSTADNEVFGYQEYGADYRYHPDVVTGLFRPTVSAGLSKWTYVNKFSTHPTLKGFLIGGDRFKDNVDETLSVQSETAGYQFFSMVHLDVVAVRPMPLHSIPGLLDHH